MFALPRDRPRRQAPGEVDGDVRSAGLTLATTKRGPIMKVGMRPRGEKYPAVTRHRRGHRRTDDRGQGHARFDHVALLC